MIQGKSGLTSILPAPVHAAKKEAGRILLPYSLTKKTQSAVSNAAAPKKSNTSSQDTHSSQQLSAGLTGYGSDSDDEDEARQPVSFFSLDKSVNKTDLTVQSSSQKQMVGPSRPPENIDSFSETGIPTVPQPPTFARTSLNLPAPAKSNNSKSENESLSVSSSKNVSDTVDISAGPIVDQDAPLTFKGGVSSQRTFNSAYNSNSAVSSSTAAFGMAHSTAEGDQNMYYNMVCSVT